MKTLALSLAAGATAAAFAFAPLTVAAQPTDAVAVVPQHGDWTLSEREKWLDHAIDRARDDGSIDHVEYDRVQARLHDIRHDEDRMRDRHDGQLTDNETAMLETRLDGVADAIHWLHQHSFEKPW